jgi:hypothetical protein
VAPAVVSPAPLGYARQENKRTPDMPFRPFLAVVALVALSACSVSRDDLNLPPEPLGAFYLGHNIVVAENATKGPLSREGSNEAWEAAIKQAVDDRFRRFDGDKLFHIAISVDGYILAQPGIPVVAAPKSALIFGVTIWDDAAGGKINEEPHRITVFENLSGDSVVGSGLTSTAEEQMERLAFNAARAVERWMRENPEWFAADPEAQAAGPATIETVPIPALP